MEEFEKLEEIKINVTRNKVKQEFNAYTINDADFMDWFIKTKIGSLNNINRLKFRLMLLSTIKRKKYGGIRKAN